jgi:hypothetical protein
LSEGVTSPVIAQPLDFPLLSASGRRGIIKKVSASGRRGAPRKKICMKIKIKMYPTYSLANRRGSRWSVCGIRRGGCLLEKQA